MTTTAQTAGKTAGTVGANIATAMLLSREDVARLQEETITGIAGLNAIRHPIPEEATEMLRLYATCLHWMDEARLHAAGEHRTLTCAFCGQAYPDGTPATKHERLRQHIAICPAHPMRNLLAACKAAADEGQHADGCRWWNTSAKDLCNETKRLAAEAECNCYLKACNVALRESGVANG